MKVLALNPFHGGSHRAFLSGWQQHSRHEFATCTLPARKWKWRMRHAPVTFAQQLATRFADRAECDVLFTTDMLDLATFRGLTPQFASTPAVVYFHENQLTYPTRQPAPLHDRDLHFAFTNLTTAMAADAVWFNSGYHQQTFFESMREWLSAMPDYPLDDVLQQLERRASVQYPGVDVPEPRRDSRHSPLRVCWVSRWEHDKNPDLFFAALRKLKDNGHPFRLNVLGESYARSPDCFARARLEFEQEIECWGHVPSRQDYLRVLASSDIVVSTADHEFFGLGVVEAVSAGCWPLVPNALAYPEVLGNDPRFFHDSTPDGLAHQLARFCTSPATTCRLPGELLARVGEYQWSTAALRLDDALELILGNI